MRRGHSHHLPTSQSASELFKVVISTSAGLYLTYTFFPFSDLYLRFQGSLGDPAGIMTASQEQPLVLLFGYESSPFTNKVKLALRMKGVTYTYIPVPSMMPRPTLLNTFGLTYRKIPVLTIGRDLYCDTSLIIEALEHWFPESQGWGSVYPKCKVGEENWDYRGIARGFASFWTDRPFFRATTGLIPPAVWRTTFGKDRAKLIGHPLDADKLARKVPENLSNLDLHLSILEPQFRASGSGKVKTGWLLPTPKPSLADVSLYYQLRWALDISSYKGVENLSGGGTKDAAEGQRAEVASRVFNAQRYPGLHAWFTAFESYMSSLPSVESSAKETDSTWRNELQRQSFMGSSAQAGESLVPSCVGSMDSVTDAERGLKMGSMVQVAPDDTGRGDPVFGKVLALGVEEVVVEPERKGSVEIRIHFPRVGFTVRTVAGKL
ncbi:hypothetical protein M011DRAFT_452606 [Sporormia fimetaria CBS 119925]|uniref:GST N-terminal domain-containing protein n=1 Tax=Sporormia fimetaria CBS 119925 TaxID=1340428 RepID=A0A6A6UWY0_9PLEO|nr:hypothetical protein M011DRAFT_452606 [Sporormia fimetaria CBS 119925]